MKKDLVTLMDENRRSLGKARGSRLMALTPEDRLAQEQKQKPILEEEEVNPILEDELEDE
jgi:hypothetical protein